MLERLWRDVVDTKLYITGGCGALYDGASPDGSPWQDQISRVHQAYGRAYQLPHTTAHNESCANIGLILWGERMLSLTGDAKYADVIEQVAFNSLLVEHQPRRLGVLLHEPAAPGARASLPAAPPGRYRRCTPRRRPRRPTSGCASRTSAASAARRTSRAPWRGSTSARHPSATEGLYVHLYGGSDARRHDRGRSSARPARGQRLPLERDGSPSPSRMPRAAASRSTCASPAGRRARPSPSTASRWRRAQPGTYTRIEREWQQGDIVELTLPMPVRVLRAHRLAEEATNQVAVRADPSSTASRAPICPTASCSSRSRCAAARAFTPVEAEIAGHRVVVLETRGRRAARHRRGPRSTTTSPTPSSPPRPCGSSPTSRGATAAPARCRSGSPWCGDAHDPHQHVIATYVIETSLPLQHAAEVLAGEQSTGTFVRVERESDDLRARFAAQVESIEELPLTGASPLPGAVGDPADAAARGCGCGSRSTTSARRCRTSWRRSRATSSRSRSWRPSASSTSSCRRRSPSATPAPPSASRARAG